MAGGLRRQDGFDSAIGKTACEEASVIAPVEERAAGTLAYPTRYALTELTHWLACGGIPQSHRPVVRRRGESAAVRAERHPLDWVPLKTA